MYTKVDLTVTVRSLTAQAAVAALRGVRPSHLRPAAGETRRPPLQSPRALTCTVTGTLKAQPRAGLSRCCHSGTQLRLAVTVVLLLLVEVGSPRGTLMLAGPYRPRAGA